MKVFFKKFLKIVIPEIFRRKLFTLFYDIAPLDFRAHKKVLNMEWSLKNIEKTGFKPSAV